MKGGFKCCKCVGRNRGAWGTKCYDNPQYCCKSNKNNKNNKTNKVKLSRKRKTSNVKLSRKRKTSNVKLSKKKKSIKKK